MLVLTRKSGEQIIIGDEITITVIEIAGNRIRLGIEAPGDVRILRAELAQESFGRSAGMALATPSCPKG